MTSSKKQLIGFGFIALLIISLPTVIFLTRMNQDIRPKAAGNSIVGLTPVPTVGKNGVSDLCASVTVSNNLLSSGGSVNISASAKKSDIVSFLYVFSDRDNHKMIMNGNTTYLIPSFLITQSSSLANSNNISLSYDDFIKKAAVWEENPPKHIQVDVYLKDDLGNSSTTVKNCEAYFDVE